MARALTEPVSPLDAFNPPDTPSVILHDDATAKPYRDAARQVTSRRDAGVPAGQAPGKQPAEPAEAPLPIIGVSRQYLGREISRLRQQAEAGKRDLQGRFTFGAGGQQISDPAMLAMRAELAQQTEMAAAEADRLDSLDDHAICAWAYARGIR